LKDVVVVVETKNGMCILESCAKKNRNRLKKKKTEKKPMLDEKHGDGGAGMEDVIFNFFLKKKEYAFN
jgi:hypothetical protein